MNADTAVTSAPRTPPKAVPGATWWSVLLALLLVGLGVVGVQHLAVNQGWTSESSWLLAVTDALDGLTASVAVVAVGVALVLLGLALVVAALKPASRTHRPASTDADLWLSDGAVRGLARDRADRVPGVAAVRDVKVGRRAVRVDVAAQRDAADVQRRVQDDLAPTLDGLLGVRASVRATTDAATDGKGSA